MRAFIDQLRVYGLLAYYLLVPAERSDRQDLSTTNMLNKLCCITSRV
jgi:hypothetical protein